MSLSANTKNELNLYELLLGLGGSLSVLMDPKQLELRVKQLYALTAVEEKKLAEAKETLASADAIRKEFEASGAKLVAREKFVAEKEASFAKDREAMVKQQEEIRVRKETLRAREIAVANGLEDLNKKMVIVGAREETLNKRDTAVRAREEANNSREVTLGEMAKKLKELSGGL